MPTNHNLPLKPKPTIAVRFVDPGEMDFLSNGWPIVHEDTDYDPCALERFNGSNSSVSSNWRFYSPQGGEIGPSYLIENGALNNTLEEGVGFSAWGLENGVEYSLRNIRIGHVREIPGYVTPVILLHGFEYWGVPLDESDQGKWVCISPLTFEFSERVAGFDLDLPQELLDEVVCATWDFEETQSEWNYPEATDEVIFGLAGNWLRIRVGDAKPDYFSSLVFSSGVSDWFRSDGEWTRLGVIINTEPNFHRFVRPEHARDLMQVFDGGHRKVATVEPFLYPPGISAPPD